MYTWNCTMYNDILYFSQCIFLWSSNVNFLALTLTLNTFCNLTKPKTISLFVTRVNLTFFMQIESKDLSYRHSYKNLFYALDRTQIYNQKKYFCYKYESLFAK